MKQITPPGDTYVTVNWQLFPFISTWLYDPLGLDTLCIVIIFHYDSIYEKLMKITYIFPMGN